MTARQRSSASYYYDSDPFVRHPCLSYDGCNERYAYAFVDMFYMDRVYLTLDRATGEITARMVEP